MSQAFDIYKGIDKFIFPKNFFGSPNASVVVERFNQFALQCASALRGEETFCTDVSPAPPELQLKFSIAIPLEMKACAGFFFFSCCPCSVTI
jgi:hypothetical protein